LAQEAGIGPAHIGPGVGVAGTLDHPGHVEAPALWPAPRVAETPERDPDLDLIPLVRDSALGFPGEIGILVDAAGNEAADLARAFASHAVTLDAQGIDPEEKCPSMVV